MFRFSLHQMHYELVEAMKQKQSLIPHDTVSGMQRIQLSVSPRRFVPGADMHMQYLEDHQEYLDSKVHQYDTNNEKFQFLVTSSDYDPTLAAKTILYIYSEMANETQPTRSNKDETKISRLFGSPQKTTQRCLKYNTENVKNNILVCNLLYPTNTNNRHVDGTLRQF
ncbi:uncharacterized protein LOC131681546 [Topomyia yanbarensis]|uniref:uncharacterized protein LOC131681546 n=1 Tax=Topomyia yanbarensis TaxID=2498891 RepID=UPI00273B8549|nr:uncharacterized protein LOC131681546 [Topomyia yanbarensis]